jgi:hypothetical protein
MAHNPKLRRLWEEAEQRMGQPGGKISREEFWAASGGGEGSGEDA